MPKPESVPVEAEMSPAAKGPVEEEAVSDIATPQQEAPEPADSPAAIPLRLHAAQAIAEESAAPPFITAPPQPEPRASTPPKLVTVTLRTSGDHARDILTMRRVYGTLISHPGPDRFAFYVIEGRSGFHMEFPNDTTLYGDELRNRLESMIDIGSLRVETITLQ